jgi:hypothetical protein
VIADGAADPFSNQATPKFISTTITKELRARRSPVLHVYTPLSPPAFASGNDERRRRVAGTRGDWNSDRSDTHTCEVLLAKMRVHVAIRGGASMPSILLSSSVISDFRWMAKMCDVFLGSFLAGNIFFVSEPYVIYADAQCSPRSLNKLHWARSAVEVTAVCSRFRNLIEVSESECFVASGGYDFSPASDQDTLFHPAVVRVQSDASAPFSEGLTRCRPLLAPPPAVT